METPKAAPTLFQQSFKAAMWRKSLVLAFLLYGLLACVAYLAGATLTFLTFTRLLAIEAALFIGASFALSGFCYYWDFLDSKIAYRKYLGLVGYWFAFAYSVSLPVIDPNRYFFGFFKNFFSADFILGLAFMAYFTFMMLISRDSMMQKLGPHRWRLMLRGGYAAWSLLVIRAAILEWDLWISWFRTLNGFPPPRLLLSLWVIAVVLFRLSMEVSKYVANTYEQPASSSDAGMRAS